MNQAFLATLDLLAEKNHARENLLSSIQASSLQEAQERLSVYRNNIISSLTQALVDTFPISQQLLGEEFFQALSYEFIQTHLLTSPILSEFGAQFSPFIAEFEPLKDYPYIAEVAAIEYQLLTYTLCAEETPLSIEAIKHKLSTFDEWDNSVWHSISSLCLWKTSYASGSLYLAHHNHHTESLHNLDWQTPECLLLAKVGLGARCYRLDPDTFHLLQALKKHALLSDACQGLDPQTLSQTLTHLIELPIFIDIQPR